ncbi:unnamed protein product [Hydatigera taeniaeformis]|uniref:Large ribosomal subunit protein bL28m n=1 Tax=Hydatigena taeniaeformis TaxID=6205 RepID=A0A0R3WI96_HYDTA|nr:unnamed protein product [Hydatigera taeniaeformis]
MSRFLFYPHARNVIQRLPEHYKKSYLKRYAPCLGVNYIEPEEDQFIKATNSSIVPKTWGPDLRQNLFYSEILDRWLLIIVSLTALKQIECMKGLDNYLLMTPENEVNSRLGMHIKREMLLKLSDSEFKILKPEIVAKYTKFIIPRDEAEWVGLTLDEAIKKQMKIEHLQQRAVASIPKKESFTKALLNQLATDKDYPQLCMSLSHLPLSHVCVATS